MSRVLGRAPVIGGRVRGWAGEIGLCPAALSQSREALLVSFGVGAQRAAQLPAWQWGACFQPLCLLALLIPQGNEGRGV